MAFSDVMKTPVLNADDMSEIQSEGRAGLTAYSVHGKLSIQFALKKVKAQCTINQ